jgi:NAD(P)-dependent dehydrogenase (short-subunit alcohol dehydrogenase family)
MRASGASALITGGASGLGLATARQLLAQGARVTIADLPSSPGAEVAAELGEHARFVAADVTDEDQVRAAADAAAAAGPLRILVHTAGRGGPLRILDREGHATPLADYEAVIRVNLVGTYNVLRLAAERMAATDPVEGERGVAILTSSIAAWEGRIGQVHYASSKAGIVGLTLTAARDLASRLIRVVTIAPGTFDTPLLGRLPDDIRNELAAAIPHPSRLGRAEEFAALACHIVANPMLNGETIRLDGALRMTPR